MYSFNSKEELIKFMSEEIINTGEACELLQCSRQNIDDLIRRKKLVPIKTFPRDKIFFKEDILARVKREE